MIRSFLFQNHKLPGQDIELIQIQMLLADVTIPLRVDLENPSPSEWRSVLVEVFKFHPLAFWYFRHKKWF